MINLVVLGYVALMAMAAALRLRYRTWLLLVLGALAVIAIEWQHVKFAPRGFPPYRKEVVAKLRARPWPTDTAELARLIASFRAIGDIDDADVLRQLYRLEVARGLASESPEHFETVAEALAWKPPDTAPGVSTSTWREGVNAERAALKGMLEVQAPRVSGWPHELEQDAPLGDGAREVAAGVWITPKETNPLVGKLRFPMTVHNRGTTPIATARLSVKVSDKENSADAEAKPRGFSCNVMLSDVAPDETRWTSCDVTVGMGSEKVIQRLLEEIEQLRAGETSAEVRTHGELDSSVRQVPDAEPLMPEEIQLLQELKEDDEQMAARRDALVPRLQLWLVLGSIFVAGVVIPGVFGRCLPLRATVGLAFAGGALAFVVAILLALRTPGVRGWEPIIGVFAAVEYGAPFVGGLLLGNLAYFRQKSS